MDLSSSTKLILQVISIVVYLSPIIAYTPSSCSRNVSACVPLNNSVCLGGHLPYKSTSFELVADAQNYADISKNLQLWSRLQLIPRCWEVVQPFLCGVYLPKCHLMEDETRQAYVNLPDRELCNKIREPCKIIESYGGWPDFLRCDLYRRDCNIDMISVRFNTTSSCQQPLIPTTNEKSWYAGVDGCGVQCVNPHFTPHEHSVVHSFIAVFGTTSLLCNLFTMLTFSLNWAVTKRFPAIILFFINICFFLSSLGWMAQFIPGLRTSIVCKADGTARHNEPQTGSGETLLCSVIFTIIYYFLMAGLTWFVILTYAWHLTYRALGSAQDVIKGRRGYFHLLAWCLPLVLTIVCLAFGQIDGDSVSGICFVGGQDRLYRGLFLLLPIGLAITISCFFLIKGVVVLIRLRHTSPELITCKASSRIHRMIIRLVIFLVLCGIFVVMSFIIHIYTFINEGSWNNSLRDYIVCLANHSQPIMHTGHQQDHSSFDSVHETHLFSVPDDEQLEATPPPCSMKTKPRLPLTLVHILLYFMTAILMSSWVWNKSTWRAWCRNLKKKFCSVEELKLDTKPLSVHDITPGGMMKRQKDLQTPMRGSLSFISNPVDPLAINYDLTSISSRDFSSTWSAALNPRLSIQRDGRQSAASSSRRHRRFSDSDFQSISSLFEQLGLYDSDHSSTHPTRKPLLSSHDTSPISTLAPSTSLSSEISRYRFPLHRRKMAVNSRNKASGESRTEEPKTRQGERNKDGRHVDCCESVMASYDSVQAVQMSASNTDAEYTAENSMINLNTAVSMKDVAGGFGSNLNLSKINLKNNNDVNAVGKSFDFDEINNSDRLSGVDCISKEDVKFMEANGNPQSGYNGMIKANIDAATNNNNAAACNEKDKITVSEEVLRNKDDSYSHAQENQHGCSDNEDINSDDENYTDDNSNNDNDDEGDDDDDDEVMLRATSNFTIASSDTDALSIKLDSEYQLLASKENIPDICPREDLKELDDTALSSGSRSTAVQASGAPLENKSQVFTVESQSSTTTTASSAMINSTTQTVNSPLEGNGNNFGGTIPHPLDPSAQFMAPNMLPNMYNLMMGYMNPSLGPNMNPYMPYLETPIWPPLGQSPIPPYYCNPYYTMRHCTPPMATPYPPSYYSHVPPPPVPNYDLPPGMFRDHPAANIPPPAQNYWLQQASPHADVPSNTPSNQQRQPNFKVPPPGTSTYPASPTLSKRERPSPIVGSRGPSISRSMRMKFSSGEKKGGPVRPVRKAVAIEKVSVEGFKPSPSSHFKPLAHRRDRLPPQPGGVLEPKVSDKAKKQEYSRSLLEMVELMTPQLDTGTESSDEDDSSQSTRRSDLASYDSHAYEDECRSSVSICEEDQEQECKDLGRKEVVLEFSDGDWEGRERGGGRWEGSGRKGGRERKREEMRESVEMSLIGGEQQYSDTSF